jgi:hypothetical protein
MVFRCTTQKVLCLSPPLRARPPSAAERAAAAAADMLRDIARRMLRWEAGLGQGRASVPVMKALLLARTASCPAVTRAGGGTCQAVLGFALRGS